MDSWLVKYFAEFIGTAILIIIGNGTVSNTSLKGAKAYGGSPMMVAWGYAVGVMVPSVVLGSISAFINPAFTIGLAASGLFPWSHVAQFVIFQMLGAIVGQLVVVVVFHPFYKKTENLDDILGTFVAIDRVDDGTRETRRKAVINGLLTEFFGSFVLFFGATCATYIFFGDGAPDPASRAINGILVGLLVLGVIISVGSPSGATLNPARDLGPRIVYTLLPKSVLGNHKGPAKWWYSWVPCVASIVAAIVAVAICKAAFSL